jgi:hypothetical protein
MGCRLSTGRRLVRALMRSEEISSALNNCTSLTHHSLALLDIDLVADNDLIQSVPSTIQSPVLHTKGKLSGSIGLA